MIAFVPIMLNIFVQSENVCIKTVVATNLPSSFELGICHTKEALFQHDCTFANHVEHICSSLKMSVLRLL